MSKKLPDQTTGYSNNGGVVTYAPNNTAEQIDVVNITMPSTSIRILVEGDIPSNKAGTDMSVSFFSGNLPLFSAVGTWGTQGQSSQGSYKKNWKFKLRNPNTGNKLAVKIGEWLPMTSITCKGYGTDHTLIRDSLTCALWRDIVKYPSGKLAPDSAYSYFNRIDGGARTAALFSTAGVPVEIFANGTFLGLFVLRADNPPEAYLMDVNNTSHVLIQPQHAFDMWDVAFNSKEWDFPSPSVSGYDTGIDMSTLNQTVNDSAARFIEWMRACNSGAVDLRKTYLSYIDLQSLLDYITIVELSGSVDDVTNNWMAGSWDATPTSGVWRFWTYDNDATWGLAYLNDPNAAKADNIGWIMQNISQPLQQKPGFFEVAHRVFRPELRARWKMLRDSGVIDSRRITNWVQDYVGKINPDMMAADFVKWPIGSASGSVNTAIYRDAQNVSSILQYVQTRIAWIDKQWGYSGN